MYHLKTRVAFGLKFQVSFKDLHLEKAFSQIEPFLMAVFKYPYNCEKCFWYQISEEELQFEFSSHIELNLQCLFSEP